MPLFTDLNELLDFTPHKTLTIQIKRASDNRLDVFVGPILGPKSKEGRHAGLKTIKTPQDLDNGYETVIHEYVGSCKDGDDLDARLSRILKTVTRLSPQ